MTRVAGACSRCRQSNFKVKSLYIIAGRLPEAARQLPTLLQNGRQILIRGTDGTDAPLLYQDIQNGR